MTKDAPVDSPRLLVKLLPHAVGLPAYQTPGAAGLDLCSASTDLVIPPGSTVAIDTGLAVMIPSGYEGQVRGRSGLLFKHNVYVPQTGTIDSDYRGEIKVALYNGGSEPFWVNRGDRIAQLILAPVLQAVIEEVEQLPKTARGTNGFGSTGVR
jgi:dUTP pyrophosphatase